MIEGDADLESSAAVTIGMSRARLPRLAVVELIHHHRDAEEDRSEAVTKTAAPRA
ncbi:hypothetical protein [Pseudonocardia acidicola]|uniref:hypothetical protein n=1 Tax=Pseudonocardia acidicola TaxID=2724939 RepID=UPI00146BCD1F|nr:hypothetical protein [Pseudonocardia acidicola]